MDARTRKKAPPPVEVPHAFIESSTKRDRLLASIALIAGLGILLGVPFALRAGAEPLGDRPRRPVTLGPRARDAVRPPGDHDSTAAARRIAPPPVDRVGPRVGVAGEGAYQAFDQRQRGA